MIKVKFNSLDQIAFIYNYIEGNIFISHNVKIDNLINSIIETISLKLYNKYKRGSLSVLKLHKFEALALVAFYYQVQIKCEALQAANLINFFSSIDKQIN